jgi:hypothetical protein
MKANHFLLATALANTVGLALTTACHSRPNISPLPQRKKMACQLSLASH